MDSDYISIFKANNEYTANIVKSTLEDSGIEALLEPMNSSLAFDGVIALAEGFWGEVLVHKNDAERAIAVLEEYSKSAEKEE